jgi:cytidylate kinase
MPRPRPPVLTVDGPSGSGKGTVAQILAARLAWHYLDSGVLYRVLGLIAYRRGLSLNELASQVAVLPDVRAALLEKQRNFRQFPGLVTDGRDMGTTVFPDAILKVFLVASAEVRAERRYKQLKEKGFSANLALILGEIRNRDQRDSERPVSPLKPADDAWILDSSSLTIDEVVDTVSARLRTRLADMQATSR